MTVGGLAASATHSLTLSSAGIMQSTLQVTVMPIHLRGLRSGREVIHLFGENRFDGNIDGFRFLLIASDRLGGWHEVQRPAKYKPSRPYCQPGPIQLLKWKTITACCDSCPGIVK